MTWRSMAAAAPFVVVLLVASSAGTASLPSARPEEVDLSSERLGRLGQWLTRESAQGRVPGAVVLVARRGRVAYLESFGSRDPVIGAPMTSDAIFRLASMTKPFTSVAAMMLVEEGKLVLTDPISTFLPSLAKLEVSVPTVDPATGTVTCATVPAAREITVHDLLRHTAGFTYGRRTTNICVQGRYATAGVDATDLTNAGLVERLAQVPLVHQPGRAIEFGRSTDVLGRLVEVVSGTTLGQFFAARLFAPLKMTDTGFYVPAAHLGRLAAPFLTDPATRRPISSWWDVTRPPTYEAGGQGAVSTASDYWRFCQMLLNGGQLDGARLLSRTTVNLMTADHLGPALAAASAPSHHLLRTSGYTFGLGFAVRQEAGIAGVPGSVGEYTWGGAFGTYFWIDPQEALIGILMTQAPSPELSRHRKLFRQLVYQAIVD